MRLILPSLLAVCAIGCSSQNASAPDSADSSKSPTAAPKAAAEPKAPTYANVSAILTAACAKCHGQGAGSSGLLVTSVDALKKGGDHGPAIKPGDGEGSLLVQMLRGTKKPRMPRKADPLSDEDIKLISDWIQAGAPG